MISSFNSYTAGLLVGLSSNATNELLKVGRKVMFSDGQVIQSRGDLASELVVILSGHVRMTTLCEDGTELLSCILGPGQQFNEVTLFAQAARTHDALAVGDTQLLLLSSDVYAEFAKSYPEIIQALLVSNVQRVHQLIELLNDIRALPKLVVLARILYKNASELRGSGDSNIVEMDIAQEDIAMFLGVTRPYLNKIFAQLSDLGLIGLSYRKVRVLDYRGLGLWINSHLSYYSVDESKFTRCD
jgi:CRP-like cAMP-binding protein